MMNGAFVVVIVASLSLAAVSTRPYENSALRASRRYTGPRMPWPPSASCVRRLLPTGTIAVTTIDDGLRPGPEKGDTHEVDETKGALR